MSLTKQDKTRRLNWNPDQQLNKFFDLVRASDMQLRQMLVGSRSRDPVVRHESLKWISQRFPHEPALVDFANSFCNIPSDSIQPASVEVISDWIASLGKTEHLQSTLEAISCKLVEVALENRNAKCRIGALRILERLPVERVRPVEFAKLLESSHGSSNLPIAREVAFLALVDPRFALSVSSQIRNIIDDPSADEPTKVCCIAAKLVNLNGGRKEKQLLTSSLFDSGNALQRLTINCIAEFGSKGIEFAPELIRLYQDEPLRVKKLIVRALGRLEKTNERIVELLKSVASNSKSIQLKRLAFRALGRLTPHSDLIVESMVSTVDLNDGTVRQHWVAALGNLPSGHRLTPKAIDRLIGLWVELADNGPSHELIQIGMALNRIEPSQIRTSSVLTLLIRIAEEIWPTNNISTECNPFGNGEASPESVKSGDSASSTTSVLKPKQSPKEISRTEGLEIRLTPGVSTNLDVADAIIRLSKYTATADIQQVLSGIETPIARKLDLVGEIDRVCNLIEENLSLGLELTNALMEIRRIKLTLGCNVEIEMQNKILSQLQGKKLPFQIAQPFFETLDSLALDLNADIFLDDKPVRIIVDQWNENALLRIQGIRTSQDERLNTTRTKMPLFWLAQATP